MLKVSQNRLYPLPSLSTGLELAKVYKFFSLIFILNDLSLRPTAAIELFYFKFIFSHNKITLEDS